jgi:hypothetical protein
VDWVGGDIYSKFATPGIRSALKNLQHRYRHFPFVVGEYGPWDNDVNGSFTRWLMHWVIHTRPVQMAIYYRSTVPDSVFDIANFPRARSSLTKTLNSHRFLQYAPGLRPHH